MVNKAILAIVSGFFVLTFFACANSVGKKQEESFPLYDEAISNTLTSGLLGIYQVPEMLTISKLDSAALLDVAMKVAQTYSILGEEIESSGVETEGVPGQIMYNNDSANFKFECFCAIKKMPKTQLKQCKIVMLEASNMLLYNFYGPYQELYKSYDSLRKYISENNLKQVGQVRELYITDPTSEKNPGKLLTRVMVPVRRIVAK
jgi:effector-binding domain-containing protein